MLATWYRQLDTGAVTYIRKKKPKRIHCRYFNLLYKLHNYQVTIRHICSDCASTPHALGQWVNKMLQPFAKAQPAHFKDSIALKDKCDCLRLPRGNLSECAVLTMSLCVQESLFKTVLINYLSFWTKKPVELFSLSCCGFYWGSQNHHG